jgi:hypothetical protein
MRQRQFRLRALMIVAAVAALVAEFVAEAARFEQLGSQNREARRVEIGDPGPPPPPITCYMLPRDSVTPPK